MPLSLVPLLLAPLLAACTDPPTPKGAEPERVRQWKLPGRLKEISGLAMTADGRLLAHDDELGVVYELDYGAGRIVAEHPVGPPGDYEGIATLGDQVFLITSAGRLLRRPLDGAAATEAFDTGAGAQCEIEGLAARDGQLHAVCKNLYGAPETTIRILSLDRTTFRVAGAVEAPVEKPIHPSGIEWRPATGTFLVVAADDRVVVEVHPEGRVVDRQKLDKDRHRQPEGITLDGDGRMLIADEGGKGKGRLTVYP